MRRVLQFLRRQFVKPGKADRFIRHFDLSALDGESLPEQCTLRPYQPFQVFQTGISHDATRHGDRHGDFLVNGLLVGGLFLSGLFLSGLFFGGLFVGGLFLNGLLVGGLFLSGLFLSGLFVGGLFLNGLLVGGLLASRLFIGGFLLASALLFSKLLTSVFIFSGLFFLFPTLDRLGLVAALRQPVDQVLDQLAVGTLVQLDIAFLRDGEHVDFVGSAGHSQVLRFGFQNLGNRFDEGLAGCPALLEVECEHGVDLLVFWARWPLGYGDHTVFLHFSPRQVSVSGDKSRIKESQF